MNGEINARKSAAPKMEIPMELPLAGTNKIEICLLKPFCCFGIRDLIRDLEFEDSRFWCNALYKFKTYLLTYLLTYLPQKVFLFFGTISTPNT